MTEGDFLFELALAESAVLPDAVVVSRIRLGDKATLWSPDASLPPIEVGLDASAADIANCFQDSWGARIDRRVFKRDEVAPERVTLAIRWREIHRDLSLTDLLRAHDPDARLTLLELNPETKQALVSGKFNGRSVSVALPLLDNSYMMWEAMDTFIEHCETESTP